MPQGEEPVTNHRCQFLAVTYATLRNRDRTLRMNVARKSVVKAEAVPVFHFAYPASFHLLNLRQDADTMISTPRRSDGSSRPVAAGRPRPRPGRTGRGGTSRPRDPGRSRRTRRRNRPDFGGASIPPSSTVIPRLQPVRMSSARRGHLGVDAAQHVVGAELEDHRVGSVRAPTSRAGQAAGGGVARHAGVDRSRRLAPCVQRLLQPRRERASRPGARTRR